MPKKKKNATQNNRRKKKKYLKGTKRNAFKRATVWFVYLGIARTKTRKVRIERNKKKATKEEFKECW